MRFYTFLRAYLTIISLLFSYTFWGQVTLINCPDCIGDEKRLNIQGISDPDLEGGTAFHVYWYFGDGHYKTDWVTLTSPLSTGYSGFPVIHTFSDQGAPYGDGFVELTRVYTEDVPPPPPNPPKRFVFSPISCGASPCTPTIISSPEIPLKIEKNRNLVKNHNITFIIDYNPFPPCSNLSLKGKLTFNFPIAALEITSTSHSSNLITSLNEPLIWEIPYTNKSGRVFVNAKVKNSVVLDQKLDISASFDFFKQSDGAPCYNWTKDMADARVEASHDPNMLNSPSTFMSCELQENFVEYVIRFQNIGAGKAHRIEIRNIIPEAYAANTSAINTIYPTHSVTNAQLNPTITGREARWIIEDKFLRNGAENLLGYNEIVGGQVALESETIDSLVFQIQFDDDYTPAECDAIVNQAEIIFDCNPSIHTNPYILRFGCWQPGSAPDSICTMCTETNLQFCNPLESIDSLNLSQLVDVGFPPNQPCQIEIPASQIAQSQFSWYPPIGLNATNVPYPTFYPTRSTDYYRVRTYRDVNDQCRREILKLPISVPCQLEIGTSIDGCIGNGNVKVTATVTDHEPGANIVWMTPYPCNTGFTFDTIVSGPFPQGIRLTAIDRNTNCIETVELTLNGPNCNGGPHPWWVWVSIAFGGIFLIYLVNRIITNSNEPQ